MRRTSQSCAALRSWTLFLRAAIVLLGLGMLVLILWEPHIEGRNAHATTAQIYFHDPFLLYAYTSSLCFFVALYQGFKLMGLVGRDQAFSSESLCALRTINRCALILMGFILGAEGYFALYRRREDDIAGGVAIGLAMFFASAIVAAAAAVAERLLQMAVDLKSGRDLTAQERG
jgi:hypothetical protein